MRSVDARISHLLTSHPTRVWTVEHLRRSAFAGDWEEVDDAIDRAIICEVLVALSFDPVSGDVATVRLNPTHPVLEHA